MPQELYFSILGDSISTLSGYLPPDYPSFYGWPEHPAWILEPAQTWWGQVLDHFGGQLLVNNSWSGSYTCKAPGCEIESYGCSDARTALLGSNPDHILVYMGTNDLGAGFPLTGEDKLDLSIVENAYRLMLQKIRRNYPAARVWCLTLPRITGAWHGLLPQRDAFCQVIRQCAAAEGCQVIDLFARESTCDTCDGLHPNQQGMGMIADGVIAAMTAQFSQLPQCALQAQQ